VVGAVQHGGASAHLSVGLRDGRNKCARNRACGEDPPPEPYAGEASNRCPDRRRLRACLGYPLAVPRAAIAAILAAATAVALAAAPSASARLLKGFWGPTSAFSRYGDLHVDVYQMQLNWRDVAPTRPSHSHDPHDPSYQWPAAVDDAIAQARDRHMKVLLMISSTPSWANGGKPGYWAPKKSKYFANFAYAASKRYPSVHLWMVWGEPSRGPNWQPMTPQPESDANAGKRLTTSEARAPRRYARLLDAAYGQLKRASKHNLVIGGNTFSWGYQGIRPVQWVENMRFGKRDRRPRLDLYGHNPFTNRKPHLGNRPFCGSRRAGCADFSDLDWFGRVVDKYLGASGRPHVRLFLSEFTLPTSPYDREFPYYVSLSQQARWIRAGFHVARAAHAYAFGWIHLQDDPPHGKDLRISGGLIDYQGNLKPGYAAFKKG